MTQVHLSLPSLKKKVSTSGESYSFDSDMNPRSTAEKELFDEMDALGLTIVDPIVLKEQYWAKQKKLVLNLHNEGL